MPRHLKIGLLAMLAVTAVSIVYLFDATREVLAPPQEEAEAAFPAPEAPLYQPHDPPMEVRLFFPGTTHDVLLRTRNTTIFASAELVNRARQIVERLIAGPDDPGIFGSLPADTRLNAVFVSDNGTAYLDFNSAFSDNHPGGVLMEQASVYAIVNSLTYNLPEVERVKILVGGSEKETLAGHLLLLLPLEADLSITDIAPPPPEPPASDVPPEGSPL